MVTMETLLLTPLSELLLEEMEKKLEMRSATMEITSTGMGASQIVLESNLAGSDQEGPLQPEILALTVQLDSTRTQYLIQTLESQNVVMAFEQGLRNVMTITLLMETGAGLIAQVSSQAGSAVEVAPQAKILVLTALLAIIRIHHPTQLPELLSEETVSEWDQKNVTMTTHQTETAESLIVRVWRVAGSVVAEVQQAKTHDHSDLLDIIRILLLIPQFVLPIVEMDYELEQRNAMTITQRMEMAVSLIAQE